MWAFLKTKLNYFDWAKVSIWRERFHLALAPWVRRVISGRSGAVMIMSVTLKRGLWEVCLFWVMSERKSMSWALGAVISMARGRSLK